MAACIRCLAISSFCNGCAQCMAQPVQALYWVVISAAVIYPTAGTTPTTDGFNPVDDDEDARPPSLATEVPPAVHDSPSVDSPSHTTSSTRPHSTPPLMHDLKPTSGTTPEAGAPTNDTDGFNPVDDDSCARLCDNHTTGEPQSGHSQPGTESAYPPRHPTRSPPVPDASDPFEGIRDVLDPRHLYTNLVIGWDRIEVMVKGNGLSAGTVVLGIVVVIAGMLVLKELRGWSEKRLDHQHRTVKTLLDNNARLEFTKEEYLYLGRHTLREREGGRVRVSGITKGVQVSVLKEWLKDGEPHAKVWDFSVSLICQQSWRWCKLPKSRILSLPKNTDHMPLQEALWGHRIHDPVASEEIRDDLKTQVRTGASFREERQGIHLEMASFVPAE
ncbi:unnamed protein product [Vitrella brassicaformis CCMP3155]|uniref:Uncharacterized protein n=1 Tax=Vitrella brassicaformis (strain CCMP3155) TaxID=1169540 RepID=A0A0G4F4X3_VITBC|nr:unnamed protein product [Vitrella brassicaformis CCMP3155]|eukprot:CEM06870.1 unnamed protein product [Vitrella brassicaformis CCMP3155]